MFEDQLVRTRLFTEGVPERFRIVRNGAGVLFLRSRRLWAVDPGSGTERQLAAPEAGIDTYATDRAGELATFAAAGELWAVEVATGRARRLPVDHPVTDPRPDPAGRWIAYRSGGAVRVIGADGGGDRAIAAPEAPEVAFGEAAHTGGRGCWWAPDGHRLLLARVDPAGVALWHLPDPTDPAAAPRAVRYAAVGMPNADVTLWIAGLDGSRVEARWDRTAFEYVVGAGWDAHGPYGVVQSRDQRTVRLLGIDPADGRTAVLVEQRDACWVQLVPGLPARTASGALLAHADRGGTRHLTVAGAPVTPAGLQLREVLGVDGDEVLFTASDEPTETHVWTYAPGAGLRRLTAEPGVHAGVRRHGVTVLTRPRATVLREGRPPAVIASLHEQPTLDLHVTRLVLGPRELRAALYLPSWHRTGDAALPVLLDPYGGAARQQVTAEYGWRSFVAQWFAEQGFAVLVADGAGTPGRGPEWEREVHGDLLGPVLADQVVAVQEAARLHPELDVGRVGIRGWSFGATLAVAAVLRRPDVFHAAVAGAGVTDQLLYNAHWRERFLGHPADFPQRYAASSLVREAPALTRPLLLMHGLADDNVHPANTLRLSAALLAADREHEVVLLPGVGHRPMGTAIVGSLLRRQARFLRRHLAA